MTLQSAGANFKRALAQDYFDPAKRSIANAMVIECQDGTIFGEEVVEYPIGHARRRKEGMPLLLEKFKTHVNGLYSGEHAAQILEISLDRAKLEAMRVKDFMALLVK